MLRLSFSDIDGWHIDSHSTKKYASTPLLSLILVHVPVYTAMGHYSIAIASACARPQGVWWSGGSFPLITNLGSR